MRTCSHEGCDRQAKSRGMCNSHYTLWRRKFVKTAALPTMRMDDEILDALPATVREAAARAGVNYETARKAIMRRRVDEKKSIYICDWRPPETGLAGSRWIAVYALGGKKDVVVPKDVKSDFSLSRRRDLYVIHRAKKAPRTWFSALGAA